MWYHGDRGPYSWKWWTSLMLFLTFSLVVWITVWSRSTNSTSFRCFCKRSSSSRPRVCASWKWIHNSNFLPGIIYHKYVANGTSNQAKLTSELTFSSGMLCTMAMLALFGPLDVEATSISVSMDASSIFRRSLPHCAHMSFIRVGWGHSEESASKASPLSKESPFFLKVSHAFVNLNYNGHFLPWSPWIGPETVTILFQIQSYHCGGVWMRVQMI